MEVAKKVQAVHAEVLRPADPEIRSSMSDDQLKLSAVNLPPKVTALDDSGVTHANGFLVSFMVDARGGVLRGSRFPGFRVIVPPRAAAQPTRITCRLLRNERLISKPPLNAAEGLAFRVMEMGPMNLKFNRPIAIEVPHVASLTEYWREVVVLRSDNGETWREHTFSLIPPPEGVIVTTTSEADKAAVRDVLLEVVDRVENEADLRTRNVHRIVTNDFPMYFALVTRVRVQIEQLGTEGGMLNSVVVPNVQSAYPEGALQKRIRIGLQTLPLPVELVQRVSGDTRVCCSPVITIEPRRRKFHKPITLTMPIAKQLTQAMLNLSPVESQTLRLLCSITGGAAPVQWEDITGSTQLTLVKNFVTFTTTVSARFWLIDTPKPAEVVDLATRLYREACYVPYVGRFVVYARRCASECEEKQRAAQLRCFCVTDDKPEKTLELQDGFVELVRSEPTRVLDCCPHYYDVRGSLQSSDAAPGESPSMKVFAFNENRQPINVTLRQDADTDANEPARGQLAFYYEPFVRIDSGRKIEPFCTVDFDLPGNLPRPAKRHVHPPHRSLILGIDEELYKAKLKLGDVSKYIGSDWRKLGHELGVSEDELERCMAQPSDSERALEALLIWQQTRGQNATGNELAAALQRIGRADVLSSCAHDEQLVRDARERALGQKQADAINGTHSVNGHDDPLAAARERSEERERLKLHADSQPVSNIQDITALLDSAIDPRESERVLNGDRSSKPTPAAENRLSAKRESNPTIDFEAFALPTVNASASARAGATTEPNQDGSEKATRHDRFGSTEEKRRANEAVRQAVSETERNQAISDLTDLLAAHMPSEECLHPHTTAEERHNHPDEAEERVEATRKEDVKAAAPKSGPKPREAAPDDDVEEREVKSSAKQAHASPSLHESETSLPLVPDSSVETDRSESEDAISKGQVQVALSQVDDDSTRW